MKKFHSLTTRKISRNFGSVIANQSIDFSVQSGEIMALLGENGAGKSTFVKILSGLDKPDEGTIEVNKKPIYFHSPAAAQKAGIGIIHQHFMLVPSMTVAENIALCDFHTPFIYSEKKIHLRMKEFEEKYGFYVKPNAKIFELSAGEQQRVEIIKALFQGVHVLILDEPTSVLTPQEADKLFLILKQMKKEGKAIIFISHKMREIMEFTDKVTILRKGKNVGSFTTKEITEEELIRCMVGQKEIQKLEKQSGATTNVLLDVSSLSVSDDRMNKAVKNLSFQVFEKEIFGIAGIAGNGQKELVEAITGMRHIESGSIKMDGISLHNTSPKFVNKQGIAHIPEERIRYGVAPGLQLFDNTSFHNYEREPYSKKHVMNYLTIKNHTQKIIDTFQVKAKSVQEEVQNLSGGNMQKLILGREISDIPRLIVASHPTYGLDISSTRYIQQKLINQSLQGASVILVSEDLEELLSICDRIAVMFRGCLMDILSSKEASIQKLGFLMAGESFRVSNEITV